MQFRSGQVLELSHALLDSAEFSAEIDFASCLNARGMYESQRFALRLNPVVHDLVNQVVEKSVQGETEFSGEELQAYSTYIHETIHWWQHKGSTSGFLRSLLYPAQTHANLENLRNIVAEIGAQKPIKSVALLGELGALQEGQAIAPKANEVVNNFMDTEFYMALTLNPKKYDLQIYENPYFEAAGHSFLISYSLALGVLHTTFDEEKNAFPDFDKLEPWLEDLRGRKVTGYYYGSNIIRAPLGLHQLFEGQARFIQLQFLCFTCKGLTIETARQNGLLNGVYGEAFSLFLRLSESTEPAEIDDPLVALFLLVCDLSINPTVGFPNEIEDVESFLLDADPGIRFHLLCRVIAEVVPEMRGFIKKYSKEEYEKSVEIICGAAGIDNYVEALNKISRWKSLQPRIAALIEEHQSFVFSRNNIVPRVLLGEFLQFTDDKLERPEFFCWTGYWLTHARKKSELELWLKHLSLFSDQEHDGRLFARMIRGLEKEKVLEVFNQFFATVVMYDLTKQWVLGEGGFNLNYSWLVLDEKKNEFDAGIREIFLAYFGVGLEDFLIVPPPKIPPA